MRELKKCHQYFFSVEGENEKWYFEHLQKLINTSEESKFNVDFGIKVENSPVSRIKSIKIPTFGNDKITVFHVIDYESNDEVHRAKFLGTLNELKEVRINHRNYNYCLGYTNFAFELWLLLHKSYNFTSLAHRSHYIHPINEAFGTNFSRLKDNKHKEPFEKLLTKIDLSDVKRAIEVAESIRPTQLANGYSMVEYKGFNYFRENPDITINECVKRVLNDCKIDI
jgi:hypothetical protein